MPTPAIQAIIQGAPIRVEMKAPQGPGGKSAYQVAVENGFVGTEAQWLASLVGPNTVTSATTTNFTSGNVLFANSGFVGSLSRSGIDTRTSFPNNDVTNATTTGTPSQLLRLNSAGNTVANIFIALEGIEIGEEGGDAGFIRIINTNGDVVSINNANSSNAEISLPTESGTLALTTDIVDSVTSATTSDGTANLSISNVTTATATVSSLLTANHIHGNIAGTLYTHVRTGEAMTKGDPFYISGYHVGDGGYPIVRKAKASDPTTMPAIGVMDASYAANVNGANGIISGTISGINTSGFVVNKPVYVGGDGGYSNVAGDIAQQIGITERVNNNTGAFIVTNAKRDSIERFRVLTQADLVIIDGSPVFNLTTQGVYTISSLPEEVWSGIVVIPSADSGQYVVINQSNYDGVIHAGIGNPIADLFFGKRVTLFFDYGGALAWNVSESTGSAVGIREAKTDNPDGIPDALTDGTISGVTVFSDGSFVYDGGAAAAHRTALGLGTMATQDADDVAMSGTPTIDGVEVAKVVDPVRTTLTGNGSTSVYAIGGASGLTNPSALIVAIDGVLQEPTVDYGVGSGNITFTSPLPNGSKAVVISPTNTIQVGQVTPSDGSVTSSKIASGVTLVSPTITDTASFTSTTRPTSAGTGTPAATSLITKADGDKAFFPIEGLFTNAYKVPLTNNLGGASGLAAFSTTLASDITSTFTLSGASGNYATWTSSFSRCQDSGGNLVLANGAGLCAKININTSGLRRTKLLMGGLSAASVLGAGVLDARGFGVEIEPDPAATNQIRFRVIYRNQSSTTILGTWTSYYSVSSVHRIQIWTYRQDGELRAVFRTINFNSITFTNWVVIPSVTVTSGDNALTSSNRAKTLQIAAEGSGVFYAELAEMYETHNIFPNL